MRRFPIAGSTGIALAIIGLASCSASPSRVATKTSADSSCPAATFTLPSDPSALAPLSPTPAARSAAYRTLGVGGQVVVATGATRRRIFITRGVSTTDFAVSLYAHGPVPLEPVTILGKEGYLYPSEDLVPSSRHLLTRIPFRSDPNSFSDACSRWELRANGITDSQFAAYAQAIQMLPVTTTPSTAAPSTAVAPLAACSSTDLRITIGDVRGATGNWVVPIIFTDRGPHPCSMFGYPGVSWVGPDGSQIGAAAVREHSALPGTVDLRPGQFATSVVFEPTAPNQELEGCTREQRAAGLRIYPPGSRVSTVVTQGGLDWEASLTWCSNGVVNAFVRAVTTSQ